MTSSQANTATLILRVDLNISAILLLPRGLRRARGPCLPTPREAIRIRWAPHLIAKSRLVRPSQAGFREELLIRDGACILTDEVSSLVYDAAHVVPQSRPDVNALHNLSMMLTCTQVYKELQGDSYGMFEASAGLLLQITYHESYAAFKQKCRYFNPDNETQRSLNGKAIPPDRFRYLDKPDSVLVAWHYAQAVRMRIRGYSVGMVASW